MVRMAAVGRCLSVPMLAADLVGTRAQAPGNRVSRWCALRGEPQVSRQARADRQVDVSGLDRFVSAVWPTSCQRQRPVADPGRPHSRFAGPKQEPSMRCGVLLLVIRGWSESGVGPDASHLGRGMRARRLSKCRWSTDWAHSSSRPIASFDHRHGTLSRSAPRAAQYATSRGRRPVCEGTAGGCRLMTGEVGHGSPT
jgi:hypothetical protein